MAQTSVGARKAAETNKSKYGENFYQEIGKKGGKSADHELAVKTTKARYGDDFYQKIGEKGGKSSTKREEEVV